jgi:hypothetical protein
MLPTLEGMITRRFLLNYWVEPDVARRLVPAPLEVVTVNGFAVAGTCLIRLEQLRPKGLPAAVGIASENMAHRIAIRYPAADGTMRDGVFLWRRDTDSLLVTRLGGVLFPGVHRDAEFRVTESDGLYGVEVFSRDGAADVSFRARLDAEWRWTLLFPRFTDVCRFFERGDCGFSCTLREDALEGLRMRTLRWEMTPVSIEGLHSAFYEDVTRFPRGSVGFDCGVLMRGIPHEWHALRDVPELAGMHAGR